MATLSKQGHELARFEYLTYRLSYRSNGVVLKNTGTGWKIFQRCTESEIQSVINTETKALENALPEWKAFRELWVSAVRLELRGRFLNAFKKYGHDAEELAAVIAEQSGYMPDVSPEKLAELVTAWKSWLTARESLIFAVVVRGNHIVAMVRGPADFRANIARRELRIRTESNEYPLDRRCITRPATQAEVDFFCLTGNTIETPQTTYATSSDSRRRV